MVFFFSDVCFLFFLKLILLRNILYSLEDVIFEVILILATEPQLMESYPNCTLWLWPSTVYIILCIPLSHIGGSLWYQCQATARYVASLL